MDIDDVRAGQVEGLVAFSNQRWGTALTVDDYDEDWGVMWVLISRSEPDERRNFTICRFPAAMVVSRGV